MINLKIQEKKKCLSIRFNLSCLPAVFWLSICSIANADVLPQGTEPTDCNSIPYGSHYIPVSENQYYDVIRDISAADCSGPSYENQGYNVTNYCYTPTNPHGCVFETLWVKLVNGQIPQPESDCPAAGTQAAASAGWITTGNISGPLSVSSGLCTNNSPSGDLCQAKCNSGVVGRNAVTGESRLECSSYTFTGNGCEPSDISSVASPTPEIGVNGNNNAPPENPDDCPPGTGFAQINNTKTCLPGGSEYTDGSTVKTDSTTTTTKTTTTVINSDGTTTSTTTINVTNPEGGIIGSGTSTSTSGIDQAGSDKGKEFDPGPVPIIDTSLPEEGTIPTHTFTNPVFDTNLFQVAGACPAPIAFEAMGQSFSIEFDPICDLSPIIRGIILMLAAIIAIRVVVTN